MPAQTHHSPTPPDDWQPAGGDELVRLTRRIKGRKSRRQFLTASGGVVGGLLAVAGTWWLARPPHREEGEAKFAGLTCSETALKLDDLLAGRLPAAEAQQVKQHITLCPKCQVHLPLIRNAKTV